jgi:tetratricopeptide (TPR) repeat protein
MIPSGTPRLLFLAYRQEMFRMAVIWPLVISLSTPASAQEKREASRQFDRIAAQANQARDSNNLERALTLYPKALGMRPEWAEGWWSLGTIYYDRDAYAEAARAFQRVVELQPKHGSAWVMLGLCEFELKQDDFALRDIQRGKQLGILKDPQLRRVMLYHEGLLLLRKNRFEAAQQSLDLLSHDGFEGDDLVLALGMSVLRIRPENLPPAGSTASEVVSRSGKAEWLSASEKFSEARQEYSSLAKGYSDVANVHYAYGRFLLEINEIDAAIAEFQQEIQNNPQHVLARLEIAAVRYRLDSADGVKYAEQAVNLDPKRPFGHYLLGLLYLDTRNFSGAISELEIAGRSMTTVPEVYLALGNAYARAGKKAEAARARETFTRLVAKRNQASDEAVYDEHPRGLTQEKLGAETEKNPPN